MKRPIAVGDDLASGGDEKRKKIEEEKEEVPKTSAFVLMDENLLYEVLKHADALTLARAACVSRQWHETAQDERLWELICTRHWANIGCGAQQLRTVVLGLGGFRRLHSLYLWPLSKPSSPSSLWPCLPPPQKATPRPAKAKTRWGRDEVNLSLSLLSIHHYEMMNFNKRGK